MPIPRQLRRSIGIVVIQPPGAMRYISGGHPSKGNIVAESISDVPMERRHHLLCVGFGSLRECGDWLWTEVMIEILEIRYTLVDNFVGILSGWITDITLMAKRQSLSGLRRAQNSIQAGTITARPAPCATS